MEQLNQQLADLARLDEFDQFDMIDVENTQREIKELIAEITQLSASSEQLKTLRAKHQQVKNSIETTQKQRDQTLQQQTSIGELLTRRRTELDIQKNDANSLDERDPAWQRLQPEIDELGELDLASIDKAKTNLGNKFIAEISHSGNSKTSGKKTSCCS
ncbi:MAG: hypothetical protein IPK76_07125 [Lewinellaceae bacterium]|nr:hypothetical protein [Lewinellaceae bacterium]